jgi:pyruvate-formate lyase-activating enzyme
MACPSACVFCFSAEYRGSRTTGRLMDPQLMLSLIRQSAELGVKVIRFDGGGDPLTHPALPQAIDLCGELGLRVAVLTAGDLLSERLVPVFLRARTYVRVSLNAAEDTTRRAIHGQRGDRHGVQRIFDVVRLLADRRNEAFGAGGYAEMPIGATSLIHPMNVDETVAIAERAKRAGFDHLSFRVILGEALRVDFTTAVRSQLTAAFDRIRSTVADDNFQVFLPTRDITDEGYVPSRYFSQCRASTHRALIEVGRVPERAALIPCGRYRGHGYRAGPEEDRVVFGHLSPAESLGDVWLGPSMKQLLPSFPQACKDCIDRSANVFLEKVVSILNADPGSIFIPFALPKSSG